MLERFKSTANKLADTDDINSKIAEILLPLICEELGYGWGNESVVSQSILGSSEDIYLDYGVVSKERENAYAIGISLVDYGKNFDEAYEILEECLRENPNVKYGIATDGIEYKVYKLEGETFIELHSFDLRKPTKEDEEFVDCLRSSPKSSNYDEFQKIMPALRNPTEENKSIFFREPPELMAEILKDRYSLLKILKTAPMCAHWLDEETLTDLEVMLTVNDALQDQEQWVVESVGGIYDRLKNEAK